MKRVIKCAKHDEYAFYCVVGPLSEYLQWGRLFQNNPEYPNLVMQAWNLAHKPFEFNFLKKTVANLSKFQYGDDFSRYQRVFLVIRSTTGICNQSNKYGETRL